MPACVIVGSGRLALICGISLLVAGCGFPPGYLSSTIVGELTYLGGMVPVEAALNDPTLTQEQRDKLAFVVRARDYAGQVVGLTVGNSYQSFVNLGDKPLAWNLSASRADAIAPYVWDLPVVGPIAYLGFFNYDETLAERDRLVGLGYDTFVYQLDAYSAAFIPNPIASPMLKRDYGSLAEVVTHELLHHTVFKEADDVFDESLAEFVGRTAGVQFLKQDFGADDPVIEQTRQADEDSDRFNGFLQELTDELNVLYNSDLSTEEKLAQRQPIFQAAQQRFATQVLPQMHDQAGYRTYADLSLNNAFLMVNVRYTSYQDVFQGIYDLTGHDWHQAIALFAQAANAADPVGFLKGLLPTPGQ